MKSALTQVFDYVSSLRHGTLRHTWDVPNDKQIGELTSLLQKAASSSDVRNDKELVEAFHAASLGLKHYQAMSKHTSAKTDKSTKTTLGNAARDAGLIGVEKFLYTVTKKAQKKYG